MAASSSGANSSFGLMHEQLPSAPHASSARRQPPARALTPQEIKDRETRLSSLLASIGHNTLDSFEDFIFLHGASRLVPLSSDESRSLETQQFVSSTADEIHEQRKRGLAETKAELARVKKELEYTRSALSKEKADAEGLRQDLKWFLESQPKSRTDRPSSRPLGVNTGQLSSEGQHQLDEAYRDIELADQGRIALQATATEKDAELEELKKQLDQVRQMTDARSAPGPGPAPLHHEPLISATVGQDQIVDQQKVTTAVASTPSPGSHSDVMVVPAAAGASSRTTPLRTQRARHALYETIRKRYENNKRRIEDNQKWATTKVQSFLKSNATYLAQLRPVPNRPGSITLPSFTAIDDLLAAPEESEIDLTRLIDEVAAKDAEAQALASSLRDWKAAVKDLARQVAELKKASDASNPGVAVKKLRKVKKLVKESLSDGRTSSGLSSPKRSPSPSKSPGKARSPRKPHPLAVALNAPASAVAAHAEGVFVALVSTSRLASPRMRNSSPSTSGAPSKAQSQETQLPESPKKNKRKVDLELDSSASGQSKRARIASARSATMKVPPLVFDKSGGSSSSSHVPINRDALNGNLSSPRGAFPPAKGVSPSPRRAKTGSLDVGGARLERRRSSRGSGPGESQVTSSWGPEPDTEPDGVFFIGPDDDEAPRQRSSPCPSSSQATARPRRRSATVVPVEIGPIVSFTRLGSVGNSPPSAAQPSSRVSPLSPNRRAVNVRSHSTSKSVSDNDDDDDDDNICVDPPSPTPHRNAVSSPSSPFVVRQSPVRSGLLRSPSRSSNRFPSSSPERSDVPPFKYHSHLGSPPLPKANWKAIELRSAKGKEREVEDSLGPERSKVRRLRADDMVELETQSDVGAYPRRKREGLMCEKKKRGRKSEADDGDPGSSKKGKRRVGEEEEDEEEDHDRVDEFDLEAGQKSDDPTGHDFMRRLHAKRAKEAKRIAAEKAKRSGNNSPAIEINPGRNAGKSYHFYEVERNKAARDQMFAHECEECAGYYAIAHAGLDVTPNLRRKCNHVAPLPVKATTSTTTTGQRNHFLEQRQQAIQAMLQKTSRHRKHHRPDPDPPDYWQMGFPSSARVEDINARAERLRQEKRLWQEAQAKEGGFYRYREEDAL